MADNFPFYKQPDAMDCGATCLRMIARHYGKFFSLEYLRDLTQINIEGVSLFGISSAAEHIGMRTLGAQVTYEQLVSDVPLPCIAYWRQDHFVVVYEASADEIKVADPGHGKFSWSKEEFLDGWLTDEIPTANSLGTVLALEPTPDFFEQENVKTDKGGFRYVMHYFWRYPKLIFQLGLGLLVTTILAVIMPFLIQALVDEGIGANNANFTTVILGAWIALLLFRSVIEYLRGWLLLHIGIRANISLISDFIIKIVKLPMRFFDRKMTSDLLQRIYDNKRVEDLLTTSLIASIFDAITVFFLGVILLLFNWKVFIVFLVMTIAYVGWLYLFTKRRKELDYKRFDQANDHQNQLFEMVNGMQEIKLHNAETARRWAWERTEAKLFRLGTRYLAVTQWQQVGGNLINELKNILIIVFAAQAVIFGEMTIGALVAVMYILGQVNSPLEKLLSFFNAVQDAKIGLERMNEVHRRENEENPEEKIGIIPENGDLSLENVSFHYEGGNAPLVLRNIDLHIPQGKTTAIVGSSGSGKTTLVKLLLNFYAPIDGEVKLGDINLQNFRYHFWRDQCGAVLQDGYIFSDSIANNIAIGAKHVDRDRLLYAVRMANIQTFIERLPLGYNTKIGAAGMGLSQGQRQRILIARAIYKDPQYLFFDEATNALDAYNENVIMDNLELFLRGKTVVVVAHRLNTVQHADNIIVLEDGEIIEQGTHQQLVLREGHYFHLIKNQLELGS